MSKLDVLMLLKTTSLRYDDRVRKECEALRRLGLTVAIAVLEDRRAAAEAVLDDVRVYPVKLFSRRLPQGRFLVTKTLELSIRFLLRILRSRPKVIWIHNMELGGVAIVSPLIRLLNRSCMVVWDQHELPPDWAIRRRSVRSFIRWIMVQPTVLVAANASRATLLRRMRLAAKRPSVLENLTDAKFARMPKRPLPSSVVEWLGGDEYYLAQGGAAPGRNFPNLVDAILQMNRRLVVVGGWQGDVRETLRSTYGDRLSDCVHFYGWIDQMDMPALLDNCKASIVLYKSTNLNRKYCAPNRLYQAVARGVPVIVGANPPMMNHVKQLGVGVVAAGDGSDAADIIDAIAAFEAEEKTYRNSASSRREGTLFETQDRTLRTIVFHAVHVQKGPGAA